MNTSQKRRDAKVTPPDQSTVVLLLRDITSVTWRMFIPIIGATIGGILLDKYFHTKPWLMLASIIFGCVVASLLVRRQIKHVNTGVKE